MTREEDGKAAEARGDSGTIRPLLGLMKVHTVESRPWEDLGEEVSEHRECS